MCAYDASGLAECADTILCQTAVQAPFCRHWLHCPSRFGLQDALPSSNLGFKQASKRNVDSTWRSKLASKRNLDSIWPFKLASKRHLDSTWPFKLVFQAAPDLQKPQFSLGKPHFLHGGLVCSPTALQLLFRSTHGRLLTPAWSLLGASWGQLGTSSALLGRSWHLLGASWATPEPILKKSAARVRATKFWSLHLGGQNRKK